MQIAAPLLERDHHLIGRVLQLSIETRLLISPEADADTVEELMRFRAECSFQYAHCQRIWWNLTAAERDRVRWSILADHPLYKQHMDATAFEGHCIAEVARLLTQARDRHR